MSGIRHLVWNLLKTDPLLGDLGFDQDNIFTTFAADSPAAHLERWLTIRWGSSEAPVGRDATARPVAMSLWVYNRERDYEPVDRALKRCRDIFAPLVGVPCPGGGHLVMADWSFSSEDLWDDIYQAVMRNETYRIVTTAL